MTDLNIKIDKDWYCEDCNKWLACLNCEVTYQLLQTKTRALDLLEIKSYRKQNREKIKENQEIQKKLHRCWCWWYIINWNMCHSCSTSAQVYWK